MDGRIATWKNIMFMSLKKYNYAVYKPFERVTEASVVGGMVAATGRRWLMGRES